MRYFGENYVGGGDSNGDNSCEPLFTRISEDNQDYLYNTRNSCEGCLQN